jgi:hypothetical protein
LSETGSDVNAYCPVLAVRAFGRSGLLADALDLARQPAGPGRRPADIAGRRGDDVPFQGLQSEIASRRPSGYRNGNTPTAVHVVDRATMWEVKRKKPKNQSDTSWH